MSNKTLIAALTTSTALVAGSGSASTLINFDFDRDDFSHTAANVAMEGLAATGNAANDFWNDGQPEQDGGSYTDLVAADGVTNTGATLDTSFLFSFASDNADFGADLNNLMRDYAFVNPSQNGGVGTATIGGLDANVAYTLYVYAVSDNSGQSTTFSASNAAQGPTLVSSPDLNGPLTVGDDYAVFTGTTSGAGEVVITVDGNGGFAGFNGFQLEVVPEPSSLALLGLGGLLAARRRRS